MESSDGFDEPGGQGIVTAHEVLAVATQLAEACRRLHDRGLLAGSEGNLSVRLPDGDLLITPSGADKRALTAAQMVRLAPDGTVRPDPLSRAGAADSASGDIGRRPSSELGMHVACYAARPDIAAVVHAHPPVASGFATAGQGLPDDVLPELPVVLGPVALVGYARPGTPALGEAMRPFFEAHDVYLLANHGVTTLGASLESAVLRMESVEQAARILLVARLLGGERRLDASEAVALRALRTTAGATRE